MNQIDEINQRIEINQLPVPGREMAACKTKLRFLHSYRGNTSSSWSERGRSDGVLQAGLFDRHEGQLLLRWCIGSRRFALITVLKLPDQLERFVYTSLPTQEFQETKIYRDYEW